MLLGAICGLALRRAPEVVTVERVVSALPVAAPEKPRFAVSWQDFKDRLEKRGRVTFQETNSPTAFAGTTKDESVVILVRTSKGEVEYVSVMMFIGRIDTSSKQRRADELLTHIESVITGVDNAKITSRFMGASSAFLEVNDASAVLQTDEIRVAVSRYVFDGNVVTLSLEITPPFK